MVRAIPRTFGYGALLALVWACSREGSEDTPPNPGGSAGRGGSDARAGSSGASSGGAGVGGEGGTVEAGGEAGSHGGAVKGGEGGEAGASSEAGAPGGGGTGEAGGGGEGGSEMVAPGAACFSCARECESELARCAESPVCNAWLDCVAACETPECVADCDETNGAAPPLLYRIYGCLCASDCESECSVAEACDKECRDGDVLPLLTGTAPALLTDTGLYVAGSGAEPWVLAPNVRPFAPEYELFSDGAVKERYIYLPACATIDTSDMDHWSFPVGTRLWKQFTRDGVRVETRLLARHGTGTGDWLMASYQWQLPGTEALNPATAALAAASGVPDANGTGHDIPSFGQCQQCHNALSERVLGFSAIQLSHAPSSSSPLTFTELADAGRISHAPVRTGYDPPGDATAQAALGYLHANCGNCHNETGTFTQSPSMWLRLLVAHTTEESTHAYTTAVGQSTGNPNFVDFPRIAPKHPNLSSVVLRMQQDPSVGDLFPMPPIGRQLPDTAGIATVSAWIESLAE